MILLPVLGWVLLGTAPLADAPDPLAPALQGKLQCYQPDRAHRTCQSLADYVPDTQGGYRNRARILLSKAPQISFESETPVRIESGAVCGVLRKSDIDAGIVRRGEAVLTGAIAQSIRDAVSGAMAGHEVCTRYVAAGDHWIARETLDGVEGALPERTVIWVSPEDGYRVAG